MSHPQSPVWKAGRWIVLYQPAEMITGGWVMKQVAPPIPAFENPGTHDQKWRYIVRAYDWIGRENELQTNSN
jgi:hypothetical protein